MHHQWTVSLALSVTWFPSMLSLLAWFPLDCIWFVFPHRICLIVITLSFAFSTCLLSRRVLFCSSVFQEPGSIHPFLHLAFDLSFSQLAFSTRIAKLQLSNPNKSKITLFYPLLIHIYDIPIPHHCVLPGRSRPSRTPISFDISHSLSSPPHPFSTTNDDFKTCNYSAVVISAALASSSGPTITRKYIIMCPWLYFIRCTLICPPRRSYVSSMPNPFFNIYHGFTDLNDLFCWNPVSVVWRKEGRSLFGSGSNSAGELMLSPKPTRP